jgi:hypothetical protein
MFCGHQLEHEFEVKGRWISVTGKTKVSEIDGIVSKMSVNSWK